VGEHELNEPSQATNGVANCRGDPSHQGLEAVRIDPRFTDYRHDWPPKSFLARTEALDAFAEVGTIRRYEPGDCLIEEGASESEVHLLLSACAKVTAELGEGRYSLLGVRVGGDVVGELSALDGSPPVTTVRACGQSPAVALVLSQATFTQVLVEHPREAVRLSATMAAKLRTATRRRVDFTGFTPRIRLARALVDMAEDHGHRVAGPNIVIGVNLTQVELGTLIGVSEATAQRALRDLRRDGLVVTDGRRPIIRDLTALRRAAGLG
jgi:CRP/FNR family cyclic AMP-dependent transcriptional regulator